MRSELYSLPECLYVHYPRQREFFPQQLVVTLPNRPTEPTRTIRPTRTARNGCLDLVRDVFEICAMTQRIYRQRTITAEPTRVD
jgi:hypothetical protein